jgi:formylglycine-generating enzyme required for sulfatase activity
MKRIVLIVVFVLCGALIRVCADEVKVTMKNGTVFTGELKEFVPTYHVTVIVAGIESTIPISDVASVERPEAIQTTMVHNKNGDDSKLQYGKYVITDTKEYPDSFVLHIADQDLTMVLVRGGWFNMGYDGKHSLSWDSEPVHKVILSSYYVSKQFFNCHAAETLLGKKKISNNVKPYNCENRRDAEVIIKVISVFFGAPYRLLTEAEWEYAALMPFASILFGNTKDVEWCSDYFGKYSAADQINPQGPSSGEFHVLRSYSADNNMWKRLNSKYYYSGKGPFVRIAISADSIKL